MCIDPLPKVRVPIRVARLRSCKAPATISAAEAEPPLLIGATDGLPSDRSSSGRAAKILVRAAARPWVETIVTPVDEIVHGRDRRKDAAARIVAQIEGVTLERRRRESRRATSPWHTEGRRRSESMNCGIRMSADVVALDMKLERTRHNKIPEHFGRLDPAAGLSADGQLHGAVRRPSHSIGRLMEQKRRRPLRRWPRSDRPQRCPLLKPRFHPSRCQRSGRRRARRLRARPPRPRL